MKIETSHPAAVLKNGDVIDLGAREACEDYARRLAEQNPGVEYDYAVKDDRGEFRIRFTFCDGDRV